MIPRPWQRDPARRPTIPDIAAHPLIRAHSERLQAQLRSLSLLAMPAAAPPAALVPADEALAWAARPLPALDGHGVPVGGEDAPVGSGDVSPSAAPLTPLSMRGRSVVRSGG